MATVPAWEESARVFRQTGNPRYLAAVVRGILQQHISDEALPLLMRTDRDVRLAEELGLDSLAMIEFSIAAEEALGVVIATTELKSLATIGEVERLLAVKTRPVSTAAR